MRSHILEDRNLHNHNHETGGCKICEYHCYKRDVLLQHVVVGLKNMLFTVAEYCVLHWL